MGEKKILLSVIIGIFLIIGIGGFTAAQPQPPPIVTIDGYFVNIGGQATGPYDESSLRQLINQGLLTTNSFVWKEGMATWEIAGTIAELAALFATTVPGAADRVLRVGDIGPAGGRIFFDKGIFSDGWRFLEAAPASTEFAAAWGSRGRNVAGTQEGIGTGRRNTEIIVQNLRQNNETGRAAQVANALNFGGFNDWFLPSRDELNLMFQNRAAIGDLGGRWYWSSSQSDHRNDAWRQNFGRTFNPWTRQSNQSGEQHRGDKNDANSVRAIRAF